MGRILSFALLGCGRIAKKHADLLSGPVDGARLVAVCDIEPERAQAFAQRYDVPAFGSLDEMMARMGDRIDVVSVLTPSGYHARDAIAVANYGRHVVVEKPMALALADAEAMIAACAHANVRLTVVKQNRFNLPVQKLRDAVHAGRFGRIVMATVRVRWCRTQEYYDQDAWRGTWLLDGGVFANQATHHVDLLTWLVGDVDTVFARTARQLVNIEAEDTGVALLSFRNGALGVIEATTATRPSDLEGSISILGERGAVEIGGFAVNEMKVWRFSDSEPDDELILTTARQNPPDVYGFGHLAFLNHTVAAINSGTPVPVDGLEAMRSLRVINAIYESAATGNEVNLRFVPRHARIGNLALQRRTDAEQPPRSQVALG